MTPLHPTLLALAAATVLALAPPASAHGGTYSGPGSTTTPPTGGGTPTGSGGAPADTVPTGGGTGTTGGSSSAPVPGGGAPTPRTAPPTPPPPTSSGSTPRIDLAHWGIWWRFNKEPLLDLWARLARGTVLSHAGRFGRPSDEVIRDEVLPVLFAALQDDTYDGLASGALVALGRIRRPETGRLGTGIATGFASASGEVRETAGLSLGLLGDHAAMETLVGVLTGTAAEDEAWGRLLDDRMRAFAAYGTGYLGARSRIQDVKRMAVLYLVDRFADEDEHTDVRIACVNALGLVDLTWQQRLDGGPVDAPTRDRQGLVAYLLASYLDDEDELLSGHLPVTIARLLRGAPPELASATWGALLDSWSPTLDRTRAVGLMLAFGECELAEDDEVLGELRALLLTTAKTGRVALARRLALVSLARLASRPVGDTRLPDDEVCAAFEGFLTAFAKTGHRTDRPWVGLAAATYGARLRTLDQDPGPELLATLRWLVTDGGSPDSAMTAALAIGLSEDAAAGPFLLEELRDAASPTLRGFLALALGLVGHDEAAPDLVATMRQVRFSPTDLENTAVGLALLDRADASARLRVALRETTLTSLAGSLAGALGRISDAAAVPEVAALYHAEGTSNLTRTYLVVALGLACEDGRLPWFADLAAGINYVAWSPTLYDAAGKGILNLF